MTNRLMIQKLSNKKNHAEEKKTSYFSFDVQAPVEGRYGFEHISELVRFILINA